MTNEELCSQAQRGEKRKQALTALYEQNMGLLIKISKKYSYSRGLEEEDLLQQAYIGLHKAAMTYNPAAGAAFSTHAVTVIRQELYRYRMACGQAVRVPPHEMALYYEHERLARYMEANYGRKPTEAEYAYYLRVSIEKVRKIEKWAYDSYTVSLDAPVEGVDEDTCPLSDLVEDERSSPDNLIEQLAEEQTRNEIQNELINLDQLQQHVIRQRMKGLTIPQIAEELGLTSSRTRGIESKALDRLSRSRKLQQLAEGID